MSSASRQPSHDVFFVNRRFHLGTILGLSAIAGLNAIELYDFFFTPIYPAWLHFDERPGPAALLFLLYTVYWIYKSSSMPYKVTIVADGSLRFTSLLKETARHIDDLVQISPGSTLVTFHFGGQKLDMLSSIDGLDELLSFLKEKNPRLEIKQLRHGASEDTTGSTSTSIGTRPTAIQCWSCKALLEVTKENRGRKVRCPKCGTRQSLPA